MTLIHATLIAVLLALPATVLGLECLLALLPIRRNHLPKAGAGEIRLAVVIPALNEEVDIAGTVKAVREQVGDGSRVIVVADNCTDATAIRARAAGATVWERNDLAGRGKAYAVNFAFQRLRESPPDVVIIVDADCEPGPGCLDTISQLAHLHQRPVQAAYIMHAPPKTNGISAVSAFAVYVKNVVRPRGLQRVGLPCLLNGSGVAFPWKAIAAATYPEHHLAEDYRFTMDLAVAGYLVVPCMEVQVRSMLPDCQSGFASQRTRWEHGHILLSLVEPPRMLWAGAKLRSPKVWALLLELIVPPLSLLFAISLVSALTMAFVSAMIGSWIPLLCHCGLSALGVVGLAAVWLAEGRGQLSPRSALQVPAYMAMKAPFYLRFFTDRQRTWERTERNSAVPLEGPDASAPPWLHVLPGAKTKRPDAEILP